MSTPIPYDGKFLPTTPIPMACGNIATAAGFIPASFVTVPSTITLSCLHHRGKASQSCVLADSRVEATFEGITTSLAIRGRKRPDSVQKNHTARILRQFRSPTGILTDKRRIQDDTTDIWPNTRKFWTIS